MIYKKETVWYRELPPTQTFFLLPVVGGGRLLDEPKECLRGRLLQKFKPFLFFINHHSDLKMVTSPVKLYRLLPTPTPPHYDPDFKFQPMGRHEVLKHGRQVYIPPLPVRLERMCSTLTWFLRSSPMPLAPLSGLPLWFPWRECAHFLLGSLNMPCSTRCLGHIVTLLPSLLRFYSLILWLSSDATRCPFLQEVKGKYSVTHG